MFFKDVFNSYLNELNCTAKEFSLESGISEAVISRYRSGDRVPKVNSLQLNKIIDSIYNISVNKNLKYNKKDITKKLINSISNHNYFNYQNFNKIITTLNVNINDMSKYISFDASHISRIRYGKTKPSDSNYFSKKVCDYIIHKYNSNEFINIFPQLKDSDNLSDLIYEFLTIQMEDDKEVSNFLNKLDDFNLGEYIKAINFDSLKVPSIPFYRAKTRNYYGLEEMKNGEIDFFKATVLSKSKEDIFMCSDMPMEDMAKDVEFGKKWMFAIAMSLKKGLHLNIVHNIDRPFNEMMLGLESWIPLYMTGQISPYYFKNLKNDVYNHLNYTSGSVALFGECINGYHSKGKYYLTNKSDEVKYYKEKTNLLLKKASSLMDIYTKDNMDDFNNFLLNDLKLVGERKRFLHSLPLFTIDDDLLNEILLNNNIPSDDIRVILEYKKTEENNMTTLLEFNTLIDNIYIKSKEEFDKDPNYLELENIFYDKKVFYSYDQYLKHLDSTKNYINKNYKLNIQDEKTFSNISLILLEDNYALISKSINPNIHFVIRHQKLVDALSNFTPLVKD